MGLLNWLCKDAKAIIARYKHQMRTRLTRSISDKIARDIGLDQTTLARLRHQWPSDGVDHDLVKKLVSRPPRR